MLLDLGLTNELCQIIGDELFFYLPSKIFTQYIGDTHNARTLNLMNTRTQTLPLEASSKYIGDTHNERTLNLMNTCTQTLPLGASLKIVPTNPQD
jgi:hypothetical protein